MRMTILLLLISFLIKPVFSQVPSKIEMQSQMLGAINELNNQIADLEKQIAAAKKNKEDPASIKLLEDQLTMLKQQAAAMGGLNKGIAKMPDKTFDLANKEEAAVFPQRDEVRINSLPKKILSQPELSLFIKDVHAGVERMIPPVEKQQALSEYNEVTAKYKSTAITANAANGFWMIGHWEKALFIMGKVCMENISDADNLNNYAAFLIMTGAEHAAIPILEYLDKVYPGNSTILNNLGQAWYGLGEMTNAKENLAKATGLYTNHSTANAALSQIALSEGDNLNAISYLRASLKEAYDPDKEFQLEKLGYNLTFSDLPPLNYPIQKDLLGLIPLINSMPEKLQTDISDQATYYEDQRYLNGMENLREDLRKENEELAKKLETRDFKLGADRAYREEFLEPYNSPAYRLASRGLQLLCLEYYGTCKQKPRPALPFITGLWLPFYQNSPDPDALPISKLREDCLKIWLYEVTLPLNALGATLVNTDCSNYQAKWNAYLQKKEDLYRHGLSLIKKEFIQKSPRLDMWIKINLYANMDDRLAATDDSLTLTLVEKDLETTLARERYVNREYGHVLDVMDKLHEVIQYYQKKCMASEIPDPNPGANNLRRFIVPRVECEYIKKVVTPNSTYQFVLKCNTLEEKTNPKHKIRKTDVQKGAGQVGSRINSAAQPVNRRGPSASFNEINEAASMAQPLNAEARDPSQFSFDCDRWGNLINLNFQLNEDGSTLKDPGSIESGIDSRWSWNAVASGKKGHLNKLNMK